MADSAAHSTKDVSAQIESLRSELSSLAETVEDLVSNGAGTGDKAHRLARRGKKVIRKAVDKGKAAVSNVESTVSQHPLASVAVAFGIGMMLGRLFRR